MAAGSVVLSLFMPDTGIWCLSLLCSSQTCSKHINLFFFSEMLFCFMDMGVCDTRDLNQGFGYVRQVLSHWAASPDLFIFILRWGLTEFLRLALNSLLPRQALTLLFFRSNFLSHCHCTCVPLVQAWLMLLALGSYAGPAVRIMSSQMILLENNFCFIWSLYLLYPISN